ncbi:MAG: hypothetical protein QOK35_3604 [Pseudonocardiales bacterium]|nr:hypothetical protein [Pseudonocardiales bacterium]
MRSTSRSGSVRDPRVERPERENLWALFAIGLATLIVIADALGSGEFVVVGFLVIPPIVASTTTSVRTTVAVAAYCVALAVISLLWLTDEALWRTCIREVLIALAALLSVWNAVRRAELVASARGGAMLAGGLTPFDNAADEQGSVINALTGMAVPGLADLAIVDMVGSDGSIGAVAVESVDSKLARRISDSRRTRRIERGASQAMAEVVASGEPRYYKNMGDAAMREIAIDGGHLEVVRATHPRSTLILPLRSRGRTLGALTLVSLDNDDRYGKGELALAEELAARAAVALDNAKLHDEHAHLARALQRALLPGALPQVEGLEIAARFNPAVGDIGGDFYDIFQIGPNVWKAVIGDACGKGPEAAVVTSVMRDSLRAAALHGDPPSATLDLLYDAVKEAGEGRFCTAAIARFELGETTRLVTCNGGHPPPLVLRREGVVEAVGPSGTLLGVYEDVELVDTSVALEEGDLVMLYTDGLFDFSPKSVYGVRPVEELLAECKGMSAEETAGAIESAVLAAQEGEPQDDIAIVVLRLTPVENPAVYGESASKI